MRSSKLFAAWLIVVALIFGAGQAFCQLTLTGIGGSRGAPFTPIVIPGIAAWYQMDLLTGSNGDPISTIVDSTGNGNTLSQSGTARPTLATADQNGLNTANFASSTLQRFSVSSFLSGASAGSVYIVMKRAADPPAATINSGLWQIGTGASSNHWPWTDSNVYDSFGSTVTKGLGDPATSLAQYNIISIYSAASDWATFINGTSFFSTGTNTVGWDMAVYLGCEASLTVCMDGWLGEMIFTRQKQSTTDQQKTECYLSAKWNISIGHGC